MKKRFVVIDGLRVKIGSPLWHWIQKYLLHATPVRNKINRLKLVRWAKWGVKHTAVIHYSEQAIRSEWLNKKAGTLPMTTDCSGFVTALYKWSKLSDPSGLGYKELGYTGTLINHAQKAGQVLTDISKAKPGDLIVYGPGTGEHVAIIVKSGTDPLTVSHGQESEPAFVRVSQDGRKPQRILRYIK